MITLESWAEIRRLHTAEGLSIKEIVRRTGLARNTVRSAVRSDAPPKYERPLKGSSADAVEPAIRALLALTPSMPATVIAERIGWTASMTVLKDKVRTIRPDYLTADPADRLVHEPGKAVQCDLWFPDKLVPLAAGQVGGPSAKGGSIALPVLTMAWAHSRYLGAVMLPSRQGGDLLSGMWQLLCAAGAVPAELVWDRESGIGGNGRVTAIMGAFAGTLGTRARLCPARDPESKGVVERANGYLETSFLPGRTFTSPGDFNDQLSQWLTHRANTRVVASTRRRPVEALVDDVAAAAALPLVAPAVGLSRRVRLGRDYYVNLDGNAYSVHPAAIGRFVDVHATPTTVVVTCPGLSPAAVGAGTTAAAATASGMRIPTARTGDGTVIVAQHPRCWARREVIRDVEHVHAARAMRAAAGAAKVRAEREVRDAKALAAAAGVRYQGDGTAVQLRQLGDYDALFGIGEDTFAATDHARTDHARTDHARTDHARTDHARTDSVEGVEGVVDVLAPARQGAPWQLRALEVPAAERGSRAHLQVVR